MPIGGGFSPGFSSGFDADTTNYLRGVGSITATLTLVHRLSGVIAGIGVLAGQTAEGKAGFEVPYLVGLGGVVTKPLSSILSGHSSVIAALHQTHQMFGASTGGATSTGALVITGSQILQGASAGVGLLQGELFVDGIVSLSGTINGSSSVVVTITNLIGGDGIDSGFITHLYIYLSIGAGFDPTDAYTGVGNIIDQIFPDGHTVLDFWEYLYIFLSVGAGFDPTDDASDRDDFVSQIFPDGHTVLDFWEYLYLYLNVVRGSTPIGQLVIRPGFTRGPILPSSDPPRGLPQ